MVSHWSLSGNKSPQVSRTLLSILADLNNPVVWMVPISPVISKSSNPCTYPLVTVPRASIIIGIIVAFMLHSLFNSLAKSRYLSLFSDSFNLTLWSTGMAKSTILQVIFFSCRYLMIICISKSQWSLCVSFSRTNSVLCIYHLLVWSNFNFLQNSQWITLPTQSCLFLYSFWANLLHSLIMWLIVSSLSPHNLHLLFCCVLPILALIWLVLMALFYAVIRRDSVFLLRFPFLSDVRVFSREMSLDCRLKRP